MINLPKSYDSITSVIENTKDLETTAARDVVAILKGYEQGLSRHSENNTEKAFFFIMDITCKQTGRFGGQGSNAKFQKNFKTKGTQWPNKTNAPVKQWQGNNVAKVPCKSCDKLYYGKCWNKGKAQMSQVQ